MVDNPYLFCTLCPRNCGVDRTGGQFGVCGEGAELRVAAILAHHGEEPPISGTRGSGTVFFSGCSLRCSFCQNVQISREHLGEAISIDRLVERLVELYRSEGIHNVNFVTPDHFAAHLPQVVARLRESQVDIPVVYNTSGYSQVEVLRDLEPFVDIYLPDLKYSDPDLAERLSRAPDYPGVALDAIAEMVRQKGFLDSFAIARRGTLIRHLVLPGFIENTRNALSMLFAEFGRDVPISLMSQYHPVGDTGIDDLQRSLYPFEFRQAVDHANALGFRYMFVQEMGPSRPEEEGAYLPDFRLESPFRGNRRRSR
ncbi:radical SAM protein [candidate division KSB1 bacterium]|nr:radical SAM protein [candidate division KSB1 bacterium]